MYKVIKLHLFLQIFQTYKTTNNYILIAMNAIALTIFFSPLLSVKSITAAPLL